MMATSRSATVPALRDLELAVILAVLGLGDNAYPVTIRDAIEARGRRAVSRAAVFITLERLEAKGLVTSRFGDPTPVRGGRAKRFFTVEPRGIEAARRALRVVAGLTAGLESILGTK
jgi:DNA-binding PadR family transcriptional regulator